MLPEYQKIKGVHPGAILKRELAKRCIKAIDLARAIGAYPQTINAIVKERRGINPKLSIKLGEYFGVEKEYFMELQASYEVRAALLKERDHSFFEHFRKSIFWDTDISKIDLKKNRKYIIQRVVERGNESEMDMIVEYYGLAIIRDEILGITDSFNPSFIKYKAKILNEAS